MCTPPYSLLPNGWHNRLLFSLHPSLLQKSLHSGDFNCHHPLWDPRGTSEPRWEEVFDWMISSDLLPLITLTHLPFFIASLAVVSFLTSPLLPLLLPFLAYGRCYRTWVPTTYQFFYPSLSLWSFASMSVLLPSIFRKLAGMTLPPT